MRFLAFAAAALVLAGCVSNEGLKPTFKTPPVPPSIPKAIRPQGAGLKMAAPAPATPNLTAMTYSPLDSSNFLTIRAEGTNYVLAWPTNAWLSGAAPFWKTNVMDTNEVWRAMPGSTDGSDWRTTNGAMFEFRAAIRPSETRYFILSTTFSANIAWSYEDSTVTGFKLYTGTQPRTYTASTSYTYQATCEGGTNFSVWMRGLPTTQTLYLSATAFVSDGEAGVVESDFSDELMIRAQQ